MKKKTTKVKQSAKQVQVVNVTVGGRARRRARKTAPRKKKSSGSGLMSGFVTPIINYPPFQNPAIVQPVYQQAGPRLVPSPGQSTGFPGISETETHSLIGATHDNVKVKFLDGTPLSPKLKRRKDIEARRGIQVAELAGGFGDIPEASATASEPEDRPVEVPIARKKRGPGRPQGSKNKPKEGASGSEGGLEKEPKEDPPASGFV